MGPGEVTVHQFTCHFTSLHQISLRRVNTRNPERGPLLLNAGEKDHTVPSAVVTAAYKLQQHNPAVTEFREIPGRGHSLTIDHGWRDVAEIALAFIAQQHPNG